MRKLTWATPKTSKL